MLIQSVEFTIIQIQSVVVNLLFDTYFYGMPFAWDLIVMLQYYTQCSPTLSPLDAKLLRKHLIETEGVEFTIIITDTVIYTIRTSFDEVLISNNTDEHSHGLHK